MKYLNTIVDLYSNNQFARYIGIGTLNTIVGILTYPILFYSMTPSMFSYIEILYINFFITTLFSFVTTKYFVFRSDSSFVHEYIKFILIHILFLFINVYLLKMLVEDYSIHPVISQIIITIIIIFTGYYYNKLVTFKKAA